VTLGAKFVSNSYGGGEDGSEATYDSQYFNHPASRSRRAAETTASERPTRQRPRT